MVDFDDEYYLDIFQNIEMAIMAVYREQPALLDFEVDQALNALVRRYTAEKRGRDFKRPRLTDLSAQVYDSVAVICEWRLGRELPAEAAIDAPDDPLEPRTLDEIIGSLKRLRKSLKLWTGEGGRQGYLTYISGFLPK